MGFGRAASVRHRAAHEPGVDRRQHAAPGARAPRERERYTPASPGVLRSRAAVAAAAICDDSVTKLVGTGRETQFKFRGVLQEEKPLRDWLQEVLMNCLGYYTFSFGKLKIGIRENSSTVEAFTAGNILFNSLTLAALKPSFNHLTANFADQDYRFVNNSVTVYDIDYATQIGGGAGPLFLKSNVNLCGTFTKSQAARIISTRLREELGGINAAEWKAASQLAFRTTVLALNTEPGMVCSMTHDDMPGGSGEFRVSSWKLNKDYSIESRAAPPRTRCTTWSTARSPPTCCPRSFRMSSFRRHRCSGHRPWHVHKVTDYGSVRRGPYRGPARRFRQRQHRGRHRDRDGGVLRRRARHGSGGRVSTPRSMRPSIRPRRMGHSESGHRAGLQGG